MTGEYYEELFKKNIDKRVEYGNLELSLKFFLEQNNDKDLKILEVGCNIGSFTKALYDLGYKNIIACDVNSESIKYGKEKYKDIADKFHFLDTDSLPFEDNQFDVVVS